MTVYELIKENPNKVRNSPDLMAFYLEEYQKKFSKLPNCAGCTFKSDWKRFVNSFSSAKTTKTIQMEKTFKLKKVQGKILTYWVGKIPHRKYDNKLTEEFVIGYLTNGTEEEIESRKKEFLVLPKIKKEAEGIEFADKPKKKATRKKTK